MENIILTQKEFEALKKKADLLDEIEAGVAKFYPDYDEDGDEIELEDDYDLGDIGEFVAGKLGYL